MLRKRIIPIVLLDGFSVLKTIQFDVRRNLGSPITVARTYNTRNVDELVLLDIDATAQQRPIDKFTIAEIALDCFMPLTVGGGIRSLKDIEQLLKKGADKITINTIALEQPEFIGKAAKEFGSQCIVVSIDVEEMGDDYSIYNKNIASEKNLADWMRQCEDLGAGEFIVNNVTRDGKMEGGNKALAELTSTVVNTPVIYCGGIDSPENSAEIASTSVSGIGISSIFHFTDTTPDDCKQSLAKNNIPVRV